jgi:3-deoxy-manno-octulosonate cytidylyltransferase (CMP-KDO synthetase)
MKFLAVIPARYASTRFPGKPLVEINGKSMIQRVYEQVLKVSKSLEIVIATDDNRILEHAKGFGANAIMTSEKHPSGTDRCYEAFLKVNSHFDAIINIQGDEPFIKPEQIEQIMSCFEDENTEIATLKKKISDISFVDNPNIVKVVTDINSFAMYFSRSPIPHVRNESKNNWLQNTDFYKHIGIYGYKATVLGEITQLIPSDLELTESLEQLRWLENGFKIKVAETSFETFGIDTPEDLVKIKNAIN